MAWAPSITIQEVYLDSCIIVASFDSFEIAKIIKIAWITDTDLEAQRDLATRPNLEVEAVFTMGMITLKHFLKFTFTLCSMALLNWSSFIEVTVVI